LKDDAKEVSFTYSAAAPRRYVDSKDAHSFMVAKLTRVKITG
jgi:hypothetical protein